MFFVSNLYCALFWFTDWRDARDLLIFADWVVNILERLWIKHVIRENGTSRMRIHFYPTVPGKLVEVNGMNSSWTTIWTLYSECSSSILWRPLKNIRKYTVRFVNMLTKEDLHYSSTFQSREHVRERCPIWLPTRLSGKTKQSRTT